MKRIARLLPICFLALLCALPTLAKDKDKVQTIHFDFNGKQREYLILVPGSASPTAPLPAVLVVHAEGGHDTDLMGAWKGKASREGFIVVAPESTNNTQWNSRVDGPDFLHAVMADAAKKHPIDPTKIYMFGDDSGGNYAILVGLFDSQDWGAVCVRHSLIPSADYGLFKDAQRKIAFQDWIGAEDPNVSLREMALQHDEFTKAGFLFDVKIIQNSSGSYGGATMDQMNDGCYNFFMKNPLPAPGAAYLAAAEAAAPAAAPAAPPTK
jgi:poly(3-hydroxybutyrate) depolymerase